MSWQAIRDSLLNRKPQTGAKSRLQPPQAGLRTQRQAPPGTSPMTGGRQFSSAVLVGAVSVTVAACLLLGIIIGGRPPGVLTPRRVAILVPGINSESATEHSGLDSASFHQFQQVLKASGSYDDVLVFSYQCGSVTKAPNGKLIWSPTAYGYMDTFPRIDVSAAHLRCLISAYTNAASPWPVEIDLIGFSLGGMVALRYMKNHSLQDGVNVKRVMTLSSPVHGIGEQTVTRWNNVYGACTVSLDCAASVIKSITDSFGVAMADIFFRPVGVGGWLRRPQGKAETQRLLDLVNSPAAQELLELGQNLDRGRGQTLSLIQELRQRGVQVWTYVNEHDAIVMPNDAGVGDTVRRVKRGISIPDVPAGDAVMAWIDQAQRNHSAVTQILDDGPGAVEQRTMLCQDLAISCRR